MIELHKLAASAGDLRKRANLLEAQLADIDARLAKLESCEHWPPFYETVHLAPGTVTIHPAPGMRQ